MKFGLICCSLAAACLLLLAPGASAQATKARCTCDFVEQGDRKNGSEISNASACFLTDDRNTQWCDFQVESLEGSRQQAAISAQIGATGQADDRDALASLIGARFTLHFSQPVVAENFASRFDMSADEAISESLGLINGNAGLLAECAAVYGTRSGDDRFAEMDGGDTFGCGVHPGTGWLSIFVGLDRGSVYYLIAPDPS